MKTATITITCRDRKGLVAGITAFLFKRGGNIVSLDQYVDNAAKVFFMRLEWDLRGFGIAREELPHAIERFAKQQGYAKKWALYFSDTKPRLAIFASKHAHCLYDLLLRHQSGELDCEIPLIISNHETLRPIAETFGIPYHCIPVPPDAKEAAERAQLKLLRANRIDCVLLARYMQIVSPRFVAAFRSRMINVHHSFLPAFAGAKAYQQAHARGVKIIGATSHFVTEELDHGPIIRQQVADISHRDSVHDLITKGKDLERMVLAEAARLFIEHRLFVSHNRTVIL